ncbi:MAG: OsmC family protein [Thermoplasmata archaeon]
MKTFESYARWISGKKGELTFENGRRIEFSSPVDFGGVEGSVVPEELLVASLNACLHMTFLTIAQEMRLEIESFESQAEGHLDTMGNETQFVKCTLRPRVLVSSPEDVSRAEKAISLAKKRCFIANSANFEVSVEPSVHVTGTGRFT